VRRSCSHTCVRSSSSNIYADPFGTHTHTRATNSNADARPAHCHFSASYRHTRTENDTYPDRAASHSLGPPYRTGLLRCCQRTQRQR